MTRATPPQHELAEVPRHFALAQDFLGGNDVAVNRDQGIAALDAAHDTDKTVADVFQLTETIGKKLGNSNQVQRIPTHGCDPLTTPLSRIVDITRLDPPQEKHLYGKVPAGNFEASRSYYRWDEDNKRVIKVPIPVSIRERLAIWRRQRVHGDHERHSEHHARQEQRRKADPDPLNQGHALLQAGLAWNVLVVAIVTYLFCEFGFIAGLAGAITVMGVSAIGLAAYAAAFERRAGS